MSRTTRDTFKLVERLAEKHDLDCYAEQGGKHPRIVLVGPQGQKGYIIVSSTPMVRDDELNYARQQAMRLLEGWGLEERGGEGREKRRKGQRRVRSIIHRYEVAIEPETGPARDPWAVLKGEP